MKVGSVAFKEVQLTKGSKGSIGTNRNLVILSFLVPIFSRDSSFFR